MNATSPDIAEGHGTKARARATPMLFAIVGFVFVAYLVVGIGMPMISLYVHDEVRLENVVVGLVAGSPSAATLPSRRTPAASAIGSRRSYGPTRPRMATS